LTDAQLADEQNRYDYSALIIDGSTHSFLDGSFNQSAYEGIVNWIYPDSEGNYWSFNNQITHPKDYYISPDTTSQNTAEDGLGIGQKPATDQTQGFVSTYQALISKGVKSLVLPGYMHGTPVQQASTSS